MEKFVFKKIVWIIALTLMISGCSGLRIKRYVEDNIFYSSSRPRIAVKVSSDFKYVTNESNLDIAFDYNPLKTTHVNEKRFIFKRQDYQDFIIIFIATLDAPRWRFASEIFDKNNAYITENLNINGDHYQRFVYPINSDSKSMLISAMTKRFGNRGNGLIIIYYIATTEGESWSDAKSLTESQKRALTIFSENSKKHIQILDKSVTHSVHSDLK